MRLQQNDQLTSAPLALPDTLQEQLQNSGLELPPPGSEDGWTTEWHSSLRPWFGTLASAVSDGALLVIDYALEARRYYTARRDQGTLMAYRHQQSGADPLAKAGQQDLTAHLCIDTLQATRAAGLSLMEKAGEINRRASRKSRLP